MIDPSGREHTYEELSAEAESLAPGLREIGIAEGTRTVFMVPPGFHACALGVALSRVGALPIGVEPAMGPRRVAACLRRVSPSAFIGIPRAHAAAALFRWPAGDVRVSVGGRFPGAVPLTALRRAPDPAPPEVSADDIGLIAFTTGSTGPAKPVTYRHRDLGVLLPMLRTAWGGSVAVDMPTFPLFWLIALSSGGTAVIPPIDFVRGGPASADPVALMDTINRFGVRTMFASPALLENLSRYAFTHGRSAPSLERIVCAGAPVHGPLVDRVQRTLGPVVSAYGTTEALPSALITGDEILAETWPQTLKGAGICVGRPIGDAALAAIPFSGSGSGPGGFVRLAPGEIGEIAISGPHVSPRYFDDASLNKVRDQDGVVWHRTGDAGYLDADGRVWMTGRVSHRVITAREILHPLCVEPVFNEHPLVRRSALVSRNGTPIICVEPAPGAERSGLREALRSIAEGTPVEGSMICRRFPVDIRHNAKIDRPALARIACSIGDGV